MFFEATCAGGSSKLASRGKVTIIGAGLSGLSAALYLDRAGFEVTVFEKNDRIGGVVATDFVDGFFLDVGFQVILDSYPELRRIFGIDGLDLRYFDRGVTYVDNDGRQNSVLAPIGIGDLKGLLPLLGEFSLFEKLSLAHISYDAYSSRIEPKPNFASISFRDYLRKNRRLSERVVDSYIAPFMRGVTLAPNLDVTADFALFVLGNFITGKAAVPDTGMAELPAAIASKMRRDAIVLSKCAVEVSDNSVRFEDGDEVEHDYLVLAVKANEVQQILGSDITAEYRGVRSFYFATEREILNGATLKVAIDPKHPVTTSVVISQVSKSYAPKGVNLISVSSLDFEKSHVEVAEATASMYGLEGKDLSIVRSYFVDTALPTRYGQNSPFGLKQQYSKRIRIVGDYMASPSIDGAIKAGREAAFKLIG